jgi:hypothetical protein
MYALFWLAITLIGLWLLASLLSMHVQGLVLLVTNSTRLAAAAYDLLVLPGVVLHELSHVAAAFLLRVPVMRVRLFQFRRHNDLRQGEVILGSADPLRMSIIGAAPLVLGIGMLVLLLRTVMPPSTEDERSFLNQIGIMLTSPRTILGLYLLVAIANTMFPSSTDRQAWRVVGVGLLVLGIVAFVLGIRPVIPLEWQEGFGTLTTHLMAVLRSVVIIDIFFLIPVIALETLVGRARGRRVIYRSTRT